MKSKGKIIIIEGVDGAGKTTQIELLKKKFTDFIFLKEPGTTKAGQEIRKVILENNLDIKTELMLFYSARNELILNTILPLINEGKNIIIDRFELSSYAYQIYGNEKMTEKNFIDFLSKKIVPPNLIDKYIFLDLNVEIAKER